MAVNFDFKIEIPPLKIKTPKQADWLRIGINEAKEIRVRTETKGEDVEGNKFKAYSEFYKAYLRANRPTKNPNFPNLSYSTRMLGALAKQITANNSSVTIKLSGEEGGKAYGNEQRGREFFGVSQARLDKIAAEVLKEIEFE